MYQLPLFGAVQPTDSQVQHASSLSGGALGATEKTGGAPSGQFRWVLSSASAGLVESGAAASGSKGSTAAPGAYMSLATIAGANPAWGQKLTDGASLGGHELPPGLQRDGASSLQHLLSNWEGAEDPAAVRFSGYSEMPFSQFASELEQRLTKLMESVSEGDTQLSSPADSADLAAQLHELSKLMGLSPEASAASGTISETDLSKLGHALGVGFQDGRAQNQSGNTLQGQVLPATVQQIESFLSGLKAAVGDTGIEQYSQKLMAQTAEAAPVNPVSPGAVGQSPVSVTLAPGAAVGTESLLRNQGGKPASPSSSTPLMKGGESLVTSAPEGTSSSMAARALNPEQGSTANSLANTPVAQQVNSQSGTMVSEGDISFKQAIETLSMSSAVDAGGETAEEGLAKLEATANRAADIQSKQASQATRPYTTTLHSQVGDSDWSQEMNEKVVWLSSRNIKSAQIHLNPAELGPVDVKVSVQNDQTVVSFNVQNPNVRELLEANVHRLREMMDGNGVNLADVNVDSGNADQGFAAFAEQQGNGASQGNTDGADGDVEGESVVAVSSVESTSLIDERV